MKETIVENKYKIEYNDDSLFVWTFLPKAEPDIASARKAAQILVDWGKEVPKRATLVDCRELPFISSETRQYFGAQQKDNLVALALLIKSPVQQTFANLYMKFTQKATKTKVFTDYDKAISWLNDELSKFK